MKVTTMSTPTMTTPTMTTPRTLPAHVLIDSFFAAALLGRTAERELFE